ncbi:hypothetical protein ACQKOE_07415 [Novosphingobium sp. NPDC080210]|uniref:hypothetical protein n=1 Tax=Novosphingobium sp. NPDC080210 TaxID=3390596 RepID=UPI003D0595EB
MTEARELIDKAHREMDVFERTGAMTSRQLIQLAESQVAEIERLRWALSLYASWGVVCPQTDEAICEDGGEIARATLSDWKSAVGNLGASHDQ